MRSLQAAFALAALASSVLFVAACVLWARSYHIPDSVVVRRALRQPPPQWSSRYPRLYLRRVESSDGRLQLVTRVYARSRDGDYAEAGAPRVRWEAGYPVVLIPLALVPTLWLLVAFVRHRLSRASRGSCPACGYDLRATPDV